MLNCTDLECILHHHHYYAHLHHLKHGAQVDDAMSTETDGLNLNDTDSEISDLSHLDAPNESLYMIGGVCVAMVLVGVIIILLAVTIRSAASKGMRGWNFRKCENENESIPVVVADDSGIQLNDIYEVEEPKTPQRMQTLSASTPGKLRKREEHSNTVHPTTDVVLQTAAPVATAIAPQVPQPLQPETLTYEGQFLWPPPPPPFLYNKDQDTLVQNLPAERPGFVRDFRKNLGGRWRRLVKRKPTTDVYTIPAELKPQLKQIYVY